MDHVCLAMVVVSMISLAAGQLNSLQQAQWQTEEWSACSSSCGPNAQRHRKVLCYRNGRRVHNSLCYARRPTHVENCQAIDCPPESYTFTECNRTCLHGSASVWGCRIIDRHGAALSVGLSRCNISNKFFSCETKTSAVCPVFRYEPQVWSPCSITCGSGFQTRALRCIQDITIGKEENHKMCSHLHEPEKRRQCQLQSCPPKYEYDVGDWSACNTECGSGHKNRRVSCVQRWSNGTNRVVQSDICQKLHGDVNREQPCRAFAPSSCEWTRAPVEAKPCGRGETFYELTSRCRNVHTKRVLSDKFCKFAVGQKPPVKKERCGYLWTATRWTQCSASCSGGSQQRNVTCQSHFVDSTHGNPRRVEDSLCKQLHKPKQTRACNVLPCSSLVETARGDMSTGECEDIGLFCTMVRSHDLQRRTPRRLLCHKTLFQNYCQCTCTEVILYRLNKKRSEPRGAHSHYQQ